MRRWVASLHPSPGEDSVQLRSESQLQVGGVTCRLQLSQSDEAPGCDSLAISDAQPTAAGDRRLAYGQKLPAVYDNTEALGR